MKRRASFSGSRRQRLEDALAAERVGLWQDIADLWVGSYDVDDDHTFILKRSLRIRLASEALGWPTPWEQIPRHLLFLYECVESCWPLGITAQRWDREVVGEEPWRIDRELRDALSEQEVQIGQLDAPIADNYLEAHDGE